MKQLIIENIKNFTYFVKDKENNIKYKLKLDILDSNVNLKIGDTIILNEELLKESLLIIGPLDSKYGRKINNSSDKDLVIFITDNKRIVMKRLYG